MLPIFKSRALHAFGPRVHHAMHAAAPGFRRGRRWGACREAREQRPGGLRLRRRPYGVGRRRRGWQDSSGESGGSGGSLVSVPLLEKVKFLTLQVSLCLH